MQLHVALTCKHSGRRPDRFWKYTLHEVAQAKDLHCLHTASADMDAKRNDSYYSPAEDENTAIERSMMNLRDIEVRCIRTAPMCYDSSSRYENRGFYIRCAGYAVSGVISFLTGVEGSAIMEPLLEKFFQVYISQSEYFPYMIGIGIGIANFIGMVLGMEKFVASWYDIKAPKYNEAAAEWQELELRIKAFLAAAVKGTITAQDCKLFTEECAEKRKQICLIARPDEKLYKKYESDIDFVIKRLKNLQRFHEERRENGLFAS